MSGSFFEQKNEEFHAQYGVWLPRNVGEVDAFVENIVRMDTAARGLNGNEPAAIVTEEQGNGVNPENVRNVEPAEANEEVSPENGSTNGAPSVESGIPVSETNGSTAASDPIRDVSAEIESANAAPVNANPADQNEAPVVNESRSSADIRQAFFDEFGFNLPRNQSEVNSFVERVQIVSSNEIGNLDLPLEQNEPGEVMNDEFPQTPSVIEESAPEMPVDAATACIMCYMRPKNAVFVHGDTGHACCCITCAQRLFQHQDTNARHRRPRCPMCQTFIDKVIRTYD